MKSSFRTILAALPLLSSPHAVAELSEFLIPVTGSDEAIAQAKNDYFLKKSTYFAKRHRIVGVNTELLESAGQFKISLFDDISVVVEVTGLRIRPDGLSIGWSGRIIEPEITVHELIADGISPKEAKFLKPHMEKISITAAQVSYDEATGTKYQYFFPDFELYRVPSSEKSGGYDRSALYDVVATIQNIRLPHQYELRPLETDPQYHLLIEIDPEKTFSKGPMEDAENPEQAARRREYRDFKRTLGPDPRPANLHRKGPR